MPRPPCRHSSRHRPRGPRQRVHARARRPSRSPVVHYSTVSPLTSSSFFSKVFFSKEKFVFDQTFSKGLILVTVFIVIIHYLIITQSLPKSLEGILLTFSFALLNISSVHSRIFSVSVPAKTFEPTADRRNAIVSLQQRRVGNYLIRNTSNSISRRTSSSLCSRDSVTPFGRCL